MSLALSSAAVREGIPRVRKEHPAEAPEQRRAAARSQLNTVNRAGRLTADDSFGRTIAQHVIGLSARYVERLLRDSLTAGQAADWSPDA